MMVDFYDDFSVLLFIIKPNNGYINVFNIGFHLYRKSMKLKEQDIIWKHINFLNLIG